MYAPFVWRPGTIAPTLRQQGHSRRCSPGYRYWRLLRETIADVQARGNHVFDAQIVAVCREWGVTAILTEDRDFGRFSGVAVRRLG